jgi:hypothetical protein
MDCHSWKAISWKRSSWSCALNAKARSALNSNPRWVCSHSSSMRFCSVSFISKLRCLLSRQLTSTVSVPLSYTELPDIGIADEEYLPWLLIKLFTNRSLAFGNRFDKHDLLKAIIEPQGALSDRFTLVPMPSILLNTASEQDLQDLITFLITGPVTD